MSWLSPALQPCDSLVHLPYHLLGKKRVPRIFPINWQQTLGKWQTIWMRVWRLSPVQTPARQIICSTDKTLMLWARCLYARMHLYTYRMLREAKDLNSAVQQHRGELEHDEGWKVTVCRKRCRSAGVTVLHCFYSSIQYTQTPKHNNLDHTRPKGYNVSSSMGTFCLVGKWTM